MVGLISFLSMDSDLQLVHKRAGADMEANDRGDVQGGVF